MARSLALDEATIDAICEHVAKGGSVSLALRLIGGINRSTYYKYLKDARNYVELGILPDNYTDEYLDRLDYLYEALQKANAQGEMRHIENLNRLAEEENDRLSSTFMLERRYGWVKPDTHIVHHNALDEIAELDEQKQDFGKLTEQELRRLAASEEVVEGELLEAGDRV